MTQHVDATARQRRPMTAAAWASKLPRAARARVLDPIEGLARDPRPHGAKKLVGEKTAWRLRVGDYRVIYDVFDDELVVTVVRAAHRRDAYER